MRKGQAALEYIVTYGWGFLIIIVILGVLAYMGFLSPTRYIPARCSFGAQLECVDYKLTAEGANGRIYFQFRNNFGDDITITNVYTFSETSPASVTVEGAPLGTPATNGVITKGNISNIFVVNPSTPDHIPNGDRVSVPVIITFRRTHGSPVPPEHNVTGEVFATVQ